MRIYLLYLTVLYLIYNQVLITRFNRGVCSYFYPKREKCRILHLYNKLLKRRREIFEDIRKTIRNNHNIQVRTCLQNFLLNHPTSCKFLKIFKCARLKCAICNEVEELVQSPELLCSHFYCKSCWEDIGQKCLVCKICKE